MKKYRVIKPLNLFCGQIKLSASQAEKRQVRLKKIKGKTGLYEIAGQVQFKPGEIIYLKPDKASRICLEPVPEGKIQELHSRK